jgi:hypothetical protein
VRVPGVRRVERVEEAVVGAGGHAQLVVAQGEDAVASREQRHAGRVVGGLQVLGLDLQLLLAVGVELGLEDALVEVRLEPLVGEVDAQLLERVAVEGLEAEDVQQLHAVHARAPARGGGGRGGEGGVDELQHPLEEARVHVLN